MSDSYTDVYYEKLLVVHEYAAEDELKKYRECLNYADILAIRCELQKKLGIDADEAKDLMEAETWQSRKNHIN